MKTKTKRLKSLFRGAASVLLCAFLLFSLFGCSESEKESATEKEGIKVVATLFPQYSLAKEIAKDRADVVLLLPPGVDSHSFDPSMSELLKMKNADLFLYTGDAMESWAAAFIKAADENMTAVDLSEGIELLSAHDGDDEEHEEHEEHEHHGHGHNVDPHIFTSPVNALHMTRTICDALCEKDPANAAYYAENAKGLYDALSALDADARALAEQAKDKTLYFGGEFSLLYFVREYGFSYMSLYDTCSEGAEPSVRRMKEIIDAMKKDGAKVIFYPELCDMRAAKSIAECTGATPLLFHSCHNLSAKDFRDGKTYVGLMENNLQNLREALS